MFIKGLTLACLVRTTKNKGKQRGITEPRGWKPELNQFVSRLLTIDVIALISGK
jgi:hypothetical protein